MMTTSELLAIAKDLQAAAENMWQLLKHKDDYGKNFFVIGKTWDEAVADAMTKAESALEGSSRLGEEIERQMLFDRHLLSIKDN